MDDLIALYRQRLSLQQADIRQIVHEDAMVAVVYKVTLPSATELILKVSGRPNDFLREVYFLTHFRDVLPVAHIVELVQPEPDLAGAILMKCLPGRLLQKTDFTENVAFELGSLLARLHLDRQAGYGDLIQLEDLDPDPHLYFTKKFDEGFLECSPHLPQPLLEKCRHYYDTHINLLRHVDGPCIVHRDFRPGNIMIFDGKIQGIIDWASGRSGFAEEDFCPLEQGEWPTTHTLKNSFLKGYASIRAVPDYSAIMPLLFLNKAIGGIGFTVKRNTWNGSHARFYQTYRHFLERTFL